MKCNLANRALTQSEIDAVNKRTVRMNDRIFNYIGRLVVISVRKNAGFGVDRMKRFNDNAYDLGRRYIDRYSETPDRTAEEYAVDSYYALRRDLRYYGWDPEVELWSDDVFDRMVSFDGISRKKRDEYSKLIEYAKGLSFYVREMLCMNAMELHDTNGFGADKRLNVVFHPVRDRYLELMRYYITNNREAYMAELRAARDEFNALGIYKAEVNI